MKHPLPPELAAFRDDPQARRREWFRYYSEKRITHQWFQVSLLADLDVQTILEIGPNLGLVTAMLQNVGYDVTTLDVFPQQFRQPVCTNIQEELSATTPAQLSGYDVVLCCETLEHLLWDDVDGILENFRAAEPKYIIVSVPYMGFQIDWRLYFNRHRWRTAFSFKKLRWLKDFKFDAEADPWGHKWEVGYRGRSLKDLEAKFHKAGLTIDRRDFTSPTRSVFYRLKPGLSL